MHTMYMYTHHNCTYIIYIYIPRNYGSLMVSCWAFARLIRPWPPKGRPFFHKIDSRHRDRMVMDIS